MVHVKIIIHRPVHIRHGLQDKYHSTALWQKTYMPPRCQIVLHFSKKSNCIVSNVYYIHQNTETLKGLGFG